MIRFFNRRSRKKSRDFKYTNTSKSSLQNQYTHHPQGTHIFTQTSDNPLPTDRTFYDSINVGGVGNGANYGTYSSVSSGAATGNKPRYSSINALGSKDSGQDSPPEIVQYLRPPQNYNSPVRDSNVQMKDIPLTLPSPNRPPRSRDRKASSGINSSNNSQSNVNSSGQNSVTPVEMAAPRTSPFATDTSPPTSFHSPSSIPPQSRHQYPSLKPIHIASGNTTSEPSPINKHIGSYKVQQGQAAAAAAVSPTTDPPTGYAVSTRRKVFAVTQKQQATSPFSSNSGAGPNKVNQNCTSPNATDNMPHRSLPKPPEIPSGASGGYAATSRGGGSGGTSSYVPRHAKGATHDITDYSHLRQRVLVGLLLDKEKSLLKGGFRFHIFE